MNIDDYQKPIWPDVFRFLGVISFLGCCWAAYHEKSSDRAYLFGLAVGSVINCFLIAWIIETFSDIRHYTRETAIALTSKAQEKTDDSKPKDWWTNKPKKRLMIGQKRGGIDLVKAKLLRID